MRALAAAAKLDVTIDSAGTGGWHVGELPDPRSRAAAAKRGYELTHRARQFQVTDFDRFDLVVAMDRENLANLERMARGRRTPPRIALLRAYDPSAPDGAEVPDPYSGGDGRVRARARPLRARVPRPRRRDRTRMKPESTGSRAGAAVTAIDPVAGGDINDAFRVRLADGRIVFVKSHGHAPPGMFAAEAAGLDWLRAGSSQLIVPRVLAITDAWLVLEWLELDGRPDLAALGRGLAELHRAGAPSFGLDRTSYLATLPQDNTPAADWPTFYVERRLRPLCTRARLDVDAQLDRLRARADVFGPPEPPARLHGDLWWGNVASVRGVPVVIDPAVYGGHREIDLAMLALFGGLPDALIRAYAELSPLADGWRDRIALHQLYPLAAHACLFGGSYGAQVVRTLATFVG